MRRILALDYSRGLAIIGVVVLHTALIYPKKPEHIFIDSFIHNLWVFCVPIFLYLAGYFMAAKHEKSFGLFLRGKINRVYIPTIFWIVFFSVLFLIIGGEHNFNFQNFRNYSGG